MKEDFQVEVIINPAIFTSAKKETPRVKPLLDWAMESAAIIAVTDEQIHRMYYLHKTKMLVNIYQN